MTATDSPTAPVELPSGTVTFLLTDIEGSTRLFHRLGDRYPPLLERHHALLRDVWSRHGGAEFKSEGDALLVAFASARDALVAAVDGQARLRDQAWPPDAALRVRMGLHTGLAYARDGDYIALALHQAARVVGAANGGQVLCSAPTVAAAGHVTGLDVERLGRYRLRDFDTPAELFQVHVTGAAEAFPALRAVPGEGHNLTRPPDRFFGRQAELDELSALVRPDTLVTTVGLGGMGKTRLVTELGLRVATAWADGVWMVDLATIEAGGSIDAAVAETLGVAADAPDLLDAVVERLRTSAALVILDNCEHVLGSVRRVVAAVRAACPCVGLLATSREALGLRGEQVVALTPLPVDADCVELFVDRVRQLGMSVASGDTRTIAEVCRRLDGMPLAVELAAARASVLSPAEILAGLDRRLSLLRTRNPDVSDRQRSLRGLLDWSYELLDAQEQAVFRRLSVFVGSFDLETAAAVAGWSPVQRDDVDALVWSLCDKSLVHVERREGPTRYGLLETVRAFAGERCADAGDGAAVRRALADHTVATFGLEHRGARAFRTRLAQELGTLSALVGAIAEDGDAERAQTIGRIVVELDIGVSSRRALAALRRTTDLVPQPTPALARLHGLAAKLSAEALDMGAAQAHLDAARALVARFGDEDRWGPVVLGYAAADIALRDPTPEHLAEARHFLDSELARPLPAHMRADVLVELAIVQGFTDTGAAITTLEQAVELARGTDDHVLELATLSNLAEHELRRGRPAAAARAQRAAAHLAAEIGLPIVVGLSLVLAARLAQPLGRDADAVQLHGAADAVLAEVGFHLFVDDQQLSDAMLAEARAAIGDERFTAERAAGQALSVVDALALADDVFAEVISAA